MKLAEHIGTVEGNAVFEETVKMSVENESIGHIIRSLTDMYSNPLLALSREYISNAYDACIAKMGADSPFGTMLDNPIEVSLPSSLNPNFIIRDYGVGMSREVLATVFPKYGASTKRKNNAEIGGFGLGAKSALAIVANFTVVSVKEGKKNTGIVQKGADGVGEISFLPEQDTDEPSGTTVTIALPNASALNEVFRDNNLLLGFPHGSILVNGKMQENSVYNPDKYTKLSEDGWVGNELLNPDTRPQQGSWMSGYRSSVRVVVGPISYTVTAKDLYGSTDEFQNDEEAADLFTPAAQFCVLNLPIGSVDFTPARETLIFSERTRATIKAAGKRLNVKVRELMQKELEAAPGKREAVLRAEQLRSFFTLDHDLTYKGETVPECDTRILWKNLPEELKNAAANWMSYPRGGSAPEGAFPNAHYGNATVVVTGVNDRDHAKSLSRFRKPFMQKFATENRTNGNLLFMKAEKSELDVWAEFVVEKIFTVEEWETLGTQYRKEIAAEKKAQKAAMKPEGAIQSEKGSLPISIVGANRPYSFERPTTSRATAQDVADIKNVIYIHAPKDCPDNFSKKYTLLFQTKGGKNKETRDMNAALSAILNHYTDPEAARGKVQAKIVRIPSTTRIEKFLAVVPHAVSVDEALKAVAEGVKANLTDPLSVLIARDAKKFQWVKAFRESMTDDPAALIDNDEAREFVKDCYTKLRDIEDWRFTDNVEATARAIFAEGLETLFAEVRAMVEAADRFPLPLLSEVQHNRLTPAHVTQYINLMYPPAK